ncbi:PilZ domain-containing protein [Pseudofrancisella aestuarii]|uniref:PilZ domain-containing protein n=1 Tax=Pseudofrancisella aestuarii TaxID=2670347 RepID=A0ABV9TE69_9GAMM|nr:PilZ domain-containing protein [Pseudofrancisella aestuarii]
MSRLDLLRQGSSKKGSSDSKKGTTDKDLLGLSKKKHSKLEDIRDDDFLEKEGLENDLDVEPEYIENNEVDSDEDTDEPVNVIEIDLGEVSDIKSDFMEEEILENELQEEIAEQEDSLSKEESSIAEGYSGYDYEEEDIQLEVNYIFENREDAHAKYLKAIKDGGIEIKSNKILELDSIVRISVTLTELHEQVGCEARVISVLPKSVRAIEQDDEDAHKYWVQLIGPNASETEKVISRYLLGYKGKKQ